MTKETVLKHFKSHAPFPLKEDQREALDLFAQFYTDTSGEKQVFVLKGYAGTGKTTLVSIISNSLSSQRKDTYMMAPTGRAAKVMAAYSGRSAYTIHRSIYKFEGEDGASGLRFQKQKNRYKNMLFIVDEASMISTSASDGILAHLLEFVFEDSSNKLLIVGDDAQLPPIGEETSRALDWAWLEKEYFVGSLGYCLTQVIRQKEDSGILLNATMLRENYRQGKLEIELETKGYPDCFRMTGEKLSTGLEYAYRRGSMEDSILICRSNKSANLYNQLIRTQLLSKESELDAGDLVMIVKNNYKYPETDRSKTDFIANGDFARITRVRRTEEAYELRFADVELELVDFPEVGTFEAKVMLTTLNINTPNLDRESSQRLYADVVADYGVMETNRKERDKLVKADPYLNALQIKFAYALTCHKAQGGQWDYVFVDQGYLPDNTITTDFVRWLYTACTRAKQQLYFVNFHPSLFVSA